MGGKAETLYLYSKIITKDFSFKPMSKRFGPGILVAAAFIGPGTVTTCTLAGVEYGYSLLWAMLLAVVATIVLQEMAARLGILSQKGLADVLRDVLETRWIRRLVLGIILIAIVLGNAAYEGGNIGGGTLGLEAMFGYGLSMMYPWLIGLIAFLLLYLGNYRILEKVFIALVGLMSLSFLFTAIITRPDPAAILSGLFIPAAPEESLLTVIALVGTTIVPYNLFLHAALVSEKWHSADDLPRARIDTMVAIVIGGLVSMAIIVAGAAIPKQEIKTALDLAKGLEPLYGNAARYFMGTGLFAAGITSAITAPLAAAYVANSCFGWNAGFKDVRFRAVWIIILTVGVVSLYFGITPIAIIRFAQVANGLLLPIIAVLLLWLVNRRSVMGENRNKPWHNLLAGIIILMVVFLGAKSILKVLGYI